MSITKLYTLPLKYLVTYILFTLILSFFGPLEYLNYDILSVFLYMCGFMLLFSMGFIVGTCKTQYDIIVRRMLHKQNSLRMNEVLLFVKSCIFLIFIIKFVQVGMFFVEGGNLDFSKIGESYSEGYADYERGAGSYSWDFIIKIFTYLPFLVSLILGAYYFKRIGFVWRSMVVFIYSSIFILETLAHGKQKQVGDILIFLVLIFVLRTNLFSRKETRRLGRKIVTLGVLGAGLFVFILSARYTAIGIDGLNANAKSHSLISFNTEHFVFQHFGDVWGFAIAIFSGYMTQGYYGLSLSMKLPFVWTYGIGSSYAMTVLLKKFLGIPLRIEDSYPYRVGAMYGWGEKKWHSVFSWFAGDFTFWGTLLVFAGFAFLWAKVWKEALLYRNPLSILLFVNLTLGMMFIPANNQLLHSPESTLALVGSLFLWLFFRSRYNFNNEFL